MKKIFLLISFILVAALVTIISYAHPGGIDSNGGHYKGNTGEYHYHHGYSAHQHPNGECPYTTNNNADYKTKGLVLGSTYIETENLEDVLRCEFGDEYGEEIRDATVFSPDTELIDICSTYYIEYESLKDETINQYGEDISERIFSHPDLKVFSPEDVMNRHRIKGFNTSTTATTTTESTTKSPTTESEQKKEKQHKNTLLNLCIGTLILISLWDFASNKRKKK